MPLLKTKPRIQSVIQTEDIVCKAQVRFHLPDYDREVWSFCLNGVPLRFSYVIIYVAKYYSRDTEQRIAQVMNYHNRSIVPYAVAQVNRYRTNTPALQEVINNLKP